MFQFKGNFGFEFMNHLILHFKHVIKWKNNNNKIHVFLFSHKTHFEYLNHRFSCNSRLFVKYTCKVNLMEDFWFSMPKFLYGMNSMTTRTLSIQRISSITNIVQKSQIVKTWIHILAKHSFWTKLRVFQVPKDWGH